MLNIECIFNDQHEQHSSLVKKFCSLLDRSWLFKRFYRYRAKLCLSGESWQTLRLMKNT